ncbi:hypothetical protein TSOC_006172 [Tetrabaena socialis]|uniref:Pherophorin domain-containing protein n=1 Tax=Tetrabaena socialis TaxID=47790 RepID=A0A2J8A4G0_9CHLO|nr:hypothetical protein TSOC_006172 [Tetrabaena socialis]|eukprot:PNH07396.1 hypothetical protein TSOC_006172 [Tetrabaena socialis]
MPPMISGADSGSPSQNTRLLTFRGLGSAAVAAAGSSSILSLCVRLRAGPCTSLEALCMPPQGMPPGICTATLASATANGTQQQPTMLSVSRCAAVQASIAGDINTEAANGGIALAAAFAASNCSSLHLRVCGSLYDSDWDGAAGLQDFIYVRLDTWVALVLLPSECVAATYGTAVQLQGLQLR